MQRDLALDRLKGLAVIVMVISHVWLFQIGISDTADISDIAILLISRVCAPIFVFSYAYVLVNRRDVSKHISRLSKLALACAALSLLMLVLTASPYAIHVLYVLLGVSLLAPALGRLDSSTLLAAMYAILFLHVMLNASVIELPGAMTTAVLLGGELSSSLTMNFGVLALLPFMLLGIVASKSNTDRQYLKPHIWIILLTGVVFLVPELMILENKALYSLASINMLITVAVILAYWYLKSLTSLDKILLPFGRNVLTVYLFHLTLLFLLSFLSGRTQQFGAMMQGEYVYDFSNGVKLLACVGMILCCYAVLQLNRLGKMPFLMKQSKAL